jgi:hypothetical protein
LAKPWLDRRPSIIAISLAFLNLFGTHEHRLVRRPFVSKQLKQRGAVSVVR